MTDFSFFSVVIVMEYELKVEVSLAHVPASSCADEFCTFFAVLVIIFQAQVAVYVLLPSALLLLLLCGALGALKLLLGHLCGLFHLGLVVPSEDLCAVYTIGNSSHVIAGEKNLGTAVVLLDLFLRELVGLNSSLHLNIKINIKESLKAYHWGPLRADISCSTSTSRD